MLRKFFGRGDPDSPKGRACDDGLLELYRRLEREDQDEGVGSRTMRFEAEATEEQMDYIVRRVEDEEAEADAGGWPARVRPTVWDDARRRLSSGGASRDGDDDDASGGGGADEDDLARDGRIRLSRAAAVHAFQGLDALRHDGRFTDVSLVCGDGARLPCHRVVLCASSAYFRSLLVERDAAASPDEALRVLPTLPAAGVRAAVDYAYGSGLAVLADARADEADLRAWDGLDGALRALRHFEMGHAVEHVFRCAIRALDARPRAYLLAVDLHGLADAHGCDPLKHKAWHVALGAKWAAYKRPCLEAAIAEHPVADDADVDDALRLAPWAADARRPPDDADLAEPPYDARTAVAAWHRKLKDLRAALDPKPPSEYGSEYGDADYERYRRATTGDHDGGGDDDDGHSAMDESDEGGAIEAEGPML